MAYDFNTDPYYDDFNKTNKFYRILFKPGYAVQARELNQIQSIIQNQIDVHGKHIFKEGSMVIPGSSSIDVNVNYVKLELGIDITGMDTKTITGATSGVTAQVIIGVNAEYGDYPTLYVKYTSSGTDTTTKIFLDGEVLLFNDTSIIDPTVKAAAATGVGSIATVIAGWYFVKGAFVFVNTQTIILDKYTNSPTYKIGLEAIESIVTSDNTETLLDNAQGSPNYAAPGADRYSIDLVLKKKHLNIAIAGTFIIGQEYTINYIGTTDFTLIGATENNIGIVFTATGIGAGTGEAIIKENDFIQLIVVESGITLQQLDHTEYSILEETLARRTYDESGDYTVKKFGIDIREHRNNFRGVWVSSTNYLSGDIVTNASNYYRCRVDGQSNTTPPTQIVGSTTVGTHGVVWTFEKFPFFNRGIFNAVSADTLVDQNIAKAKLAIGIEPGKAYVHGYEIEKKSTSYVGIDKARVPLSYTNSKVETDIGNYVVVRNINAMPDISSYPLVSLYNYVTATVGVSAGTLIGTARIRYFEFDNSNTQGTQTTNYKVSLFDVKMINGYNFNNDVKQLFINGGSAPLSFSADITPVLTKLSGSISTTTTAVTGVGTQFSKEVEVGNYIAVTIAGVTTSRRITAITSGSENTLLTVDSSFGVTIVGEAFYFVSTTLIDVKNESLVYPFPSPYVKTVTDANTSYTVAKYFGSKVSVDDGSTSHVTITLTAPDTFASASEKDNYLVVDVATGLVVVPTGFTGAGTASMRIDLSNINSSTYNIIAAVNRSAALTRKTKTLSTTVVTKTTAITATTPRITLGKADGLRLLSVNMDTGTFASPTTVYTRDITSKYDFDDGQRLSFYDLAAIVLKAGELAPTAPIQINFEYFAHSGSGDHFNVGSYTASISYDEIPTFRGIPLSWMLDFRPRIDDGGTTFTAAPLMPKLGMQFETDFDFYLGRRDKILLNQDGSFFSVTGSSALAPQDPESTSNGMLLYKLAMDPYTYSTNSLQISTIDNKRYTMRDIGKLEKRIDNIEYYTSLSLLEVETQSLEIQDSTGLNRFKNGFIVDNFSGHGTGDIYSADYDCSIDMEHGELRPTFHVDNINLIEENFSDAERDTDHYQVTGDLITLKYTESELVKQADASRVENINPFAIFTFIGQTELNPASDEWFETFRMPDIITNVDGNFDTINTLAAKSGILTTVWNAWQNQWTGVTTTVRTWSTGGSNWANSRALSQGYTYVADFNTMFGGAGGGGPARQVVADLSATLIGQSRSGVRTAVVPKIDTQMIADRTVSTAVIPYIRARNLLFVVRSLKPNTKFTPFFDSVDVSTFSHPATVLTINKLTMTGLFSSSDRSGADSSEVARLVSGNSESALDRGDVVFAKTRAATFTGAIAITTGVLTLSATGTGTVVLGMTISGTNITPGTVISTLLSGSLGANGSTYQTNQYTAAASTTITGTKTYTKTTSPATGVLALINNPLNQNISTLHLVNVIGTFLDADILNGSISAAVATINPAGVVAHTLGSNLVSNNHGDVVGIFNIPNTDSNRFRCGTREFKLSDDATDNAATRTSRATKQYLAEGILESKQASFVSTRNGELRQEVVTDTQTIIQTSSRVISDTGWYDPLAQTFLVQSSGGAFVTSIDIFFATKDTTIPVRIQIREVVNGYPGKTIIPFSELVLTPDLVNISTATLVETTAGELLPPPVATNFKFQSPVYLNDKTEYCIVLVSDSNNYKAWISQLGETSVVNGRLISEQPYAGVLFKSQNASTWTADQSQDLMFTIHKAKFDTANTGLVTLTNNALPNVLLDTDPLHMVVGSNYVRVAHLNHGLFTGSSVVISGAAGTISGVTAAELNATFAVVSAELDSYIILLPTTSATFTGKFGGATIRATKNVQFNTFQPVVQQQSFPDTDINYEVLTHSGKSVNGSETPYAIDGAYSTVAINENNEMIDLAMIATTAVETSSMAGSKSFKLRANMSSANENVSPVIDIARLSLITVQDRVNNPSLANINYAALDTRVITASNANLAVTNTNRFSTTDSATKSALLTIGVGKYITTSGFVAADSNGTFLVTYVEPTGLYVKVVATMTNVGAGASVTMNILNRYVSEIAPSGSSSVAKYVTKKINLANSSSMMKIRFAADVEQLSDVSIYYKTQNSISSSDWETLIYTLATPTTAAVKSDNGVFSDVSYDIIDIPDFNTLQVKLVINSTAGADICRIKDLQIIACA